MRANRIGWGLVVFFAVVGAAFTAAAPDIWLGKAYIGCAAGLAVLYLWMNRHADRGERLLRDGIRGEAEILEVDQTGGYLNGQPRMRLRLRVDAPGVQPFERSHTYTVPYAALDSLAPGRSLPVALDRHRPARFAIDWR